jgi:hypothetical protein
MTAPSTTRSSRTTRSLLGGGVLAGPLFIILVVAQEATRAGFDPKRHALSQLSTGDLGWLQIANFIGTGLLFLGCAVGMRRVLTEGRAARWGPRLVGVFGVALVWGGVFVTDPVNGYPPGTPEDTVDFTWHGILHGLAPTVAGIAVVAACIVFARRFAANGERGWAGYSVASAAVYLILAFAAFPAGDFRLMLAGGVLAWGWISVVAAKLPLGRSV